MSLTATIKTGATSVAATGGDDQDLIPLGIVNNTNTVFYDDDGAYSERRTAEFGTKAPKVNPSSPGGYTQERRTVVFRRPITLADGSITVETLRVELATASETDEADKVEMLEQVAQIMVNSDFADFWHEGVLI
jgi:hypothetical protein